VEIRQLEPRHIWKLAEANWPEIEKYVFEFDWNCLGEVTADQALDIIMSVLDSRMQAHIPRFMKSVQKSNLPQLNDKCHEAVAAKHDVEGAPDYEVVAASTAEILCHERNAYVAKLKHDMENLLKISKQRWSLNKHLLNRQALPFMLPPIKNTNDIWCRTPRTKADAFAVCWTAKCKLPAEAFEHYFCQVADGMSGWFPIRPRDVKKILLKLKDALDMMEFVFLIY
jgi:hypothetical protein